MGDMEEEKLNFSHKEIIAKARLLLEEDIPESYGELEVLDSKHQDYYYDLAEKKLEEEARRERTPEEKEEIERKARRDRLLYMPLLQEWMGLFNRHSYLNPVPGEIMFRVLLSCLMKDLKIFKNKGENLDTKLHFFWCQPTGSGKDRALEFTSEIISMLNKIHLNKEREVLINSYGLNGTESDEVLLDHYGRKTGRASEYDFNKPIPGILSENDFIFSRECSFLFRELNKKSGIDKRDILLEALEGRPIEKRLVGWSGRTTITVSNACFVGVSRPVIEMKRNISESGLMQRGLSYCRDLNNYTRERMFREVAMNIVGTEEDFHKSKAEKEKLAENIYELYLWMRGKKIEYKNIELIEKTVHDNLLFLNKELKGMIRNKDIIQGFIARFSDILLILSLQNALLRKSFVANAEDVQNAFVLLKEVFNSLLVWTEEVTEVNINKERQRRRYKNFITFLLQANKEVTSSELAIQLQSEFEVSRRWAMELIRKYKANEL